MKTFRKRNKLMAIMILLSLSIQTLFPLQLFSVNGPEQPEFSGFEPIGNEELVNLFTGDFQYSIPILTVPGKDGLGYSINLGYSSASKPDDDASWVGYGWTLNAGSITRNVNGFPDDNNGNEVKYWHKFEPTVVSTATLSAGLEAWANKDIGSIGVGASVSIQNHSKLGWSVYRNFFASGGFDIGNVINLGLNYTNNSQSGTTVGYSLGLSREIIEDISNSLFPEVPKNETDIHGIGEASEIMSSFKKLAGDKVKSSASTRISNFTLTPPSRQRPRVNTEYKGSSVFFEVTGKFDVVPQVGLDGGISGSRTTTEPRNDYDAVQTYGYLYSGNAYKNAENLMDYAVEKQIPFKSKDKYLPIPYSNPDMYVVNANGVNGSFRAWNSNAGHFRPDKKKSETHMLTAGVSLDLGFDWGGGIPINIGSNKLETNGATYLDESLKFDSTRDIVPPYFFRFNGDLGDQMVYTLDGKGEDYELVNIYAEKSKLNRTFSSKINNNGRVNSAASIDYNTHINPTLGGDPNYLYYSKNRGQFESPLYTSLFSHVFNPHYGKVKDNIYEFSILNNQGMRYNFGQPVYARNERDFQFIINEKDVSFGNNNIMHKSLNVKTHPEFIGTESNAPYPYMYLLTSIESSDYIDKSAGSNQPNGTYDKYDDGAWVNFGYSKAAGADFSVIALSPTFYDKEYADIWYDQDLETASGYKKWYKWRQPYTGAYQQRNSVSDLKDNRLSVKMGEREVYYLEKIETPTHVAYFITNKRTLEDANDSNTELRRIKEPKMDNRTSIIQRKDAYPASLYELKATWHNEETPHDRGFDNISERLEKIVLYAKDLSDPENKVSKCLKIIHFDYNYEIFPGQPNSINKPSSTDNEGKLTLKKVWVESGDVKEAEVSPYEFDYEYPTNTNLYPAKYSAIANYSTGLYETPDYSAINISPWGEYQLDSYLGTNSVSSFLLPSSSYNYTFDNRFLNQIPGVNQNPPSSFDPAAWKLKRIVLPSGGEIHVQYEQNEYTHVQDRDAMFLSVIDSYDGNGEITISKETLEKLYGDLTTNNEFQELGEKIKNEFTSSGKNNFLYYKFLYSLLGNFTPDLAENNCNNEFITGYAKVSSVNVYPNEIKIHLASGGILPKEQCREFVKMYRNGQVSLQNECGDSFHNGNISSDFQKMLSFIGTLTNSMGETIQCLRINPLYSYIKIPTPKPKKGGGVRAKRVLYFDKFNKEVMFPDPLDNMKGLLYGQEYQYTDLNGSCSGVATNEPGAMREENPLVGIIDWREGQSWYGNLLYGETLEQNEGPLGEYLLPGPSIGYSSVIVKNIHEGKTDQGVVHHEFYTTKDFPYDKKYNIDGENKKSVDYTKIDQDEPVFIKGASELIGSGVYGIRASQGYQFIKNNMHGVPKKVSSFSNYSIDPNDGKITPLAISSSTTFEYFTPGEKIPVFKYNQGETPLNFDPEVGYLNSYVDYMDIGLETEMVFETSKTTDITKNVGGRLDFTLLTGPFPFPFLGAVMNSNYLETYLETHVTNKIVNYPALLKKKEIYQDGISQTIENVAFHESTGNPIVTRVTDTYDTPQGQLSLFNFNFPAEWFNEEMGQSSQNLKAFYESNKNGNQYILNYNSTTGKYSISALKSQNECVPVGNFASGDLIKVTDFAGDYIGMFHVESASGSDLSLLQAHPVGSLSGLSLPQKVNFEVIKSGYTNQLVPNAGSLTLSSVEPVDPITKVSNTPDFAIDAFTGTDQSNLQNRVEFTNQLNNYVVTSVNNFLSSLPNNDFAPTANGVSLNLPGIDVCKTFSDFESQDGLRVYTDIEYAPYTVKKSFYTFDLNKALNIKICFEYDVPTPSYINDGQALADDLNKWLNKAWIMNLQDYIPKDIYDFGDCDWGCPEPFCDHSKDEDDGTPNQNDPETQKYLTQGTNVWYRYPANSSIYDWSLIWLNDLIDEATGLDKIFDKTYYINGQNKKGSEILTLEDQTPVNFFTVPGGGPKLGEWVRKPETGPGRFYIHSRDDDFTAFGGMFLFFKDEISDASDSPTLPKKNYSFIRMTEPYGYFCGEDFHLGSGAQCRTFSDCRNFNNLLEYGVEHWWRAMEKYPASNDFAYNVPTAGVGTLTSSNVNYITPSPYPSPPNPDLYNGQLFSTLISSPSPTHFTDNIGEFFVDGKFLKYRKKVGAYGVAEESIVLRIREDADPPSEITRQCCYEFEVNPVVIVPPLQYDIPPQFSLSEDDGYQLVNNSTPCTECVSLCDPIYPSISAGTSIINHSSTLYSDDNSSPTPYSNPYLSGERGKWRIKESYVNQQIRLNTPTLITMAPLNFAPPPQDGAYHPYNSVGDYKKIFDWNNTSASLALQHWIKNSEITEYNSDGNPIEAKDIQDIPSIVLYDDLLNNQEGERIKVVAKHADKNSVYFQDYEFLTPINGIAHTGEHSSPASVLHVIDVAAFPNMSRFGLTQEHKDQGITILFWYRFNEVSQLYINPIPLNAEINFNTTPVPVQLEKIASSGEWNLIRGIVPHTICSSQPLSATLKFKINDLMGSGVIDDFLVKPSHAEVNCFVYENNTNIISETLDNNHFATFYQRNSKNELVRIAKETARGKRFVSEQHMNQPKRYNIVTETEEPRHSSIKEVLNGNQFEMETQKGIDSRIKNELPKTRVDTVETKFNIFDFNLDTKKSEIKIFDKNLNELKKDSTESKTREKKK